jgi:tripartite-type tricarboxylate transporter receptor subunit TctC
MLKTIAVVTVCSVAITAHAAEQTFPTKPIRFIVPTATGGGSDPLARALGTKYSAAWGQQVVVDNRPGAGMTIGIDLVAKASPDGHTMVLVNPSHAINATLMTKLPYDAVRDLTPVTVIATQPLVMVVSQSLPVKNVRELIALAKAKPREVSYASSGPGSASHLAAEMLSGMTGIELSHVPYKGTGPALPDLISGRVQLYINPLLAMIGAVEGGRLRVLAVTSAKRVATLPDVPTVAESGVPGYEATSWYMLLVPGKTPASVVSKINAETLRALKDKDMIDLLTRGGADPLGNSPREAMEFLKVEIARWGKAVKQAGVKVD